MDYDVAVIMAKKLTSPTLWHLLNRIQSKGLELYRTFYCEAYSIKEDTETTAVMLIDVLLLKSL